MSVIAQAELLSALLGWGYVALVVVGVLAALYRKEEPAAALGWTLAIVFLPGVGLVLFAVFGVNEIPRRLRRIIQHHEAFEQRFRKVTGAYEPGRWGHPGARAGAERYSTGRGSDHPFAGGGVGNVRRQNASQ